MINFKDRPIIVYNQNNNYFIIKIKQSYLRSFPESWWGKRYLHNIRNIYFSSK